MLRKFYLGKKVLQLVNKFDYAIIDFIVTSESEYYSHES